MAVTKKTAVKKKVIEKPQLWIAIHTNSGEWHTGTEEDIQDWMETYNFYEDEVTCYKLLDGETYYAHLHNEPTFEICK